MFLFNCGGQQPSVVDTQRGSNAVFDACHAESVLRSYR